MGEFETVVRLRGSVRAPRAEPGAPLVLALHGWGMTARTFERWLAPALQRPGLSWWIPQGILPLELKAASRRRIGYAWYVFDGDQTALRASMDQACSYLAGLAETARRALRPRSLGLLGFSQGAYLASYLALQRPDLFQSLVCCAGRPKAEFIEDFRAARDLRILVQFGREDESTPPELIAKGVGALRDAGLSVDERGYAAGHRLTPEMASEAAEFFLCD